MSSAMQRMFAAAGAALIVLGVTAGAPAQGQAQGRWVKLAPIPEKTEEVYFGTANGKMVVIGPTGIVQEYDPASNQWTKKKNMPLPSNHMAVAPYRDKLYVFGGAGRLQPGGPNNVLNNAWEYDPAADSWKALAPMPTRRVSPVAAEVGGKIYVMGGAGHHPGAKDPAAPLGADTPHRSLDTNEVYDPATDKWETRQTMPTARNHAAAGVVGGKIYVIGGRIGALNVNMASNTNVVEVYDPAADTWGLAGARMPTIRSGFGSATYRGRIFVVGGQNTEEQTFSVTGAVEAYDPATNTWTRFPPLAVPRHGIAVAVIGNRLYVAGGHIMTMGGGGVAAHSDLTEAFEFADQ